MSSLRVWGQPAVTCMMSAMELARDADLQMLASYDFSDRNEADIRGEWIETLLRLLGYGIGTRHRVLRRSRCGSGRPFGWSAAAA